MSLEKAAEDDVFARVGEFEFQAEQKLRAEIEKAGGVNIDFKETAYGTKLIIKLANAGSCGC